MSEISTAPSVAAQVMGPIVIGKVARRLMWYIMALYFFAILDRGNISFAALSMNRELGLTAGMFGIGVGVMYATYSLFEIPSNLVLARIGARRTLGRIAILWGLATLLMTLTVGPLTLYLFRGLLGLAESGLFPGVMLLLSMWFPFACRARYNAMFNYVVPMAYVFSSLISGSIMSLDGTFGIAGWKWLFLIEGLPPIALGVFGLYYLTDRAADATWLSASEKEWLRSELQTTAQSLGVVHGLGLASTLRQPMVLLFGLTNFGLFCGLASLSPWLPQILKAFGLTVFQVGLLAAVPPLGGLIGMIVLSRHSDRLGERFYYAAAVLLLAAVGFACAAFSTSLAAVVASFFVASIGVFASQAVFWTIPQSYVAPASAPAAMGLIGMLGSIGGAVVPMAIGRIKDGTGNYTGGFLIVCAALLGASLLILAARRRLPH